MSSPRLLAVAAMALASALIPASASAALSSGDVAPVPHGYGVYTDGQGAEHPKWTADGILGPNEDVDLDFPLADDQAPFAYQGGSGLLFLDNQNLSTTTSNQPFAPSSGGFTQNTSPYTVHLGSNTVCGTNLPVHLLMGNVNQTFNYGIPTGAAGAYRRYQSYDVGNVIYDGGSTESVLPIDRAALTKGLQVHIDAIDHQYSTYWLEIALISPAGTKVVLFSQEGATNAAAGNAANRVLRNVTFSETAVNGVAPIAASAAAQANFTNVVIQPKQSLSAFDGESMTGNWKLSVRDISQPLTPRSNPRGRTLSGPEMAQLGPWQLSAAGPLCSGTPEAWFGDTPLILDPAGDTLDASGSRDPSLGGSIATYQWDLDGNATNGPGGQGFEVSTSTPTVPFPATAETLRDIRLRVVDNQGNVSPIVTRTAIVSKRPQPGGTTPSGIAANPATPIANQAVTLTATATDVETPSGNLIYTWDLNDDGVFDDGSGAVVTKTWATSGPVVARVKVTDGKGAFSVFYQLITISNTLPTARAVTNLAVGAPAIVGQELVFSGATSSDVDGTIASYAWDLDGSGRFDFVATTPTVPYTFTDAGEHLVRLKVTDNTGGVSDEFQLPIWVTGLPVGVITASSDTPLVGEAVTFSAAGSHDSDPGGSIVNYGWDLDNNGSFETSGPTAVSASKSFPNAGSVTVRLQLTDNDGAKALVTKSLLVRNPVAPPPPTPPSGGGKGAGGGTGGTGGGGGTGGAGGGVGTPTQGTDPTQLAGGGFLGEDPPAEGIAEDGFTAALNASAKQKAKKAIKNGVAVALKLSDGGSIVVKAMVSPKDAKLLGLTVKGTKAFAIGSGKLQLKKSGKGKFVVKIAKRYQRYIKKATKLPVVLRGVVTSSSGTQVAIARKVVFVK